MRQREWSTELAELPPDSAPIGGLGMAAPFVSKRYGLRKQTTYFLSLLR